VHFLWHEELQQQNLLMGDKCMPALFSSAAASKYGLSIVPPSSARACQDASCPAAVRHTYTGRCHQWAANQLHGFCRVVAQRGWCACMCHGHSTHSRTALADWARNPKVLALGWKPSKNTEQHRHRSIISLASRTAQAEGSCCYTCQARWWAQGQWLTIIIWP
jgi:hypothetical protein